MAGKKKITVLHVLKSSIYSGAENVVITIMTHLREEYRFIYVATDGAIRNVLEKEKVEFFLFPKISRKNISKAIEWYSPDIVHAHDFSASVICASIVGKYRLISHLHYDPPWSRQWNLKTLVYSLLSKKMDCILAVSKDAYKNTVFSEFLEKKVVVIGNPIDSLKIVQLGGEKIIVPKYDLLFVGRFVEQKDPKRFIEIIKALGLKKSNIKCAMLGDGELLDECKRLVEKYNLSSNIDFLGFQNNPYVYMSAAKLLCMTSKWEGFGLVAVEANILGLPVISTKTGGLNSLFGEDAIELCDDNVEFIEKIFNLLSDDSTYEIWCTRAQNRRMSFVSIEHYMNKLQEIYKG